MRCKNSKEREEDGGKVLKRDQGKKKRERGRKTERCYRVKREFVLNTCYTYVLCSIQECVRAGEREEPRRGCGGPRGGESASMFY